MKEALEKIFMECIQHSEEKDLEVLSTILHGFNKTLSKKNSTYIGGLLQMETSMQENALVLEVPISKLLDNTLGVVHGGITATILDTAMGTLANKLLSEGQAAVTSQLNTHYLAPGIGNKLICTAKLIHQGKKTIVVEGEVQTDNGKKIAYSTGTFFVIRKVTL